MLIADLHQRQDFGGADNRRIQACLAAIVQEHRIQHNPRRRREAKAHIAHPEHHMHAGEFAADATDRFHGGSAVAAVFFDACGDRQGEGVVEDLVGRKAVFQGVTVGPLGDGELALRRAGHALLIDGAHHHTGAVIAGQFEHLEEALVAIFVVGGIEDAFATGNLQAGLHLLPLGGIEHQRQVHIRDQPAHQFAHVALAVAADVVDVDIEHMGVLLHLAAAHCHQAIPVLLGQQFAHLLAAAGIEPLADDQEGVVLQVGGHAVQRGGGGLVSQGRTHRGGIGCDDGMAVGGLARRCGAAPHGPGGRMEFGRQLSQGADVGRGGAAAATDHLHPQVLNEVQQLHLHLGGGEAVMGHPADVLRQAGIGDAAHHEGAVLTEVAHVLLHLLWPGGAVEAEHIDREGLQDRHHRGDVGAHQHRAGGFHRDRHHQGAPLARRAEGLLDALQGCLDLQHVLAGFDDEEIHVTGQQTLRLLAERGLHRVEIDVAERGQLGGGTDRASHEAGLLRGAVLIGHRSGQFGGPLVEREGLVLEAVFGQHDRGGTEGVGLDHIGPDF